MSLSPYFRSPFTDLTGGMVSHQMLGKCQKQEMRYMDCLEAYGLDRGKIKCQEYFADFHECQTKTKQFKRFTAMRRERDRQIAEGKLKGDEQYVNPKEEDKHLGVAILEEFKIVNEKRYNFMPD